MGEPRVDFWFTEGDVDLLLTGKTRTKDSIA